MPGWQRGVDGSGTGRAGEAIATSLQAEAHLDGAVSGVLSQDRRVIQVSLA